MKDGTRIGLENDELVSGPLFENFARLLVQARRSSNANTTQWKFFTTKMPQFDEITQCTSIPSLSCIKKLTPPA